MKRTKKIRQDVYLNVRINKELFNDLKKVHKEFPDKSLSEVIRQALRSYITFMNSF